MTAPRYGLRIGPPVPDRLATVIGAVNLPHHVKRNAETERTGPRLAEVNAPVVDNLTPGGPADRRTGGPAHAEAYRVSLVCLVPVTREVLVLAPDAERACRLATATGARIFGREGFDATARLDLRSPVCVSSLVKLTGPVDVPVRYGHADRFRDYVLRIIRNAFQ